MSYSENGENRSILGELRDSDGKLPVITIAFVLINAVVFVVSDLFLYRRTDEITYYLTINPILVLEQRQYWRLFTAMFYHFGIEHLMGNMLMLYYMGSILERALGKMRYLILYFLTGLVADFASILYNSIIVSENAGTVFAAGASGAISGLLGAFTVLTMCCYKKVTLMRKKDIPVFLFFALFVGIFEQGVDHAAHLGGFLAGAVLGFLFSAHLKRKEERRRREYFGGGR